MKVAARRLIWQDFKRMHKEEDLLTEPEIEDLLFMQTIEGHSHNGDGAFRGDKFVNTTMNDITEALGRDIFVVRSARQFIIDEIYEYTERILDGENINHLVNRHGEPLMRCPLFLQWDVNPKDVLRGLYLGGLMDDFSVRKRVNEKFHINMGGGKPYLIDFRIMERMGLDGEILAHGDHEDKLDEYRKRGLIIDPTNVDYLRHSDIRFQYIRHRKGLGVSDDAAMVVGGLLYNLSVGLGAYLADAIDTLDKFSMKFIEQDDKLAHIIKKEFNELNIQEEEALSFIYLISIPENMSGKIPDSSQRYFLQIDKETNITALESHYRFLTGQPYPYFKISYERVTNEEFYKYIKKRVTDFRKNVI